MARSVREIDTNDDVYVGIKFPLSYGLNGFFFQSKTIQEQSKSNLRNLLLTTPGERVMQPLFGSDLKLLLFQNFDDIAEDSIVEIINEAVDRQLPYINIQDIFVDKDEKGNSIGIQIEYATTLDPNSIDALQLQFNIGE